MSHWHKGEKVSDHYKFMEELGRGSFAVVRKAVNKKTGEPCAIKIIEKASLDDDEKMALQNEVEILATLDHPNVVKQFEIFEDDNQMYLVLEILSGGELFDRIVEKEHYSEKEAADTIRPIIDSVRYCHSLDIIHRDLKPENLLYCTKDESSIIKVTDFGLARYIEGDLAYTACGTPGYVAPEILEGKGYGREVDYWSIGVILYIMLSGFPPFYHENNHTLFEMIKKCDFEFTAPYWDDISDNAKDLITKILVADPKKRLNADEILAHPWITSESTPRQDMPKLIETIREFNAKRKFKKAAFLVQAAVRLNKLAFMK